MRIRSKILFAILALLIAISTITGSRSHAAGFNPARIIAKGAAAYPKAGWEAGRIISTRRGNPDPGAYPGFYKAVVKPTVSKLRK